jgi:hypothetical protein
MLNLRSKRIFSVRFCNAEIHCAKRTSYIQTEFSAKTKPSVFRGGRPALRSTSLQTALDVRRGQPRSPPQACDHARRTSPRTSGAAPALAQVGEDKRFPDGACRRSLTECLLGVDVQQRTKETRIRQIEPGTPDDGLGPFETHGSSNTICPEASRVGQILVCGRGEMPTSLA